MFGRVVVTKSIPGESLLAGDVGTVVEEYRDKQDKVIGYELESFTADGHTLAVCSVPADAVREATRADLAESYVCKRLRPILASTPSGATIDDSDELRDVLMSLECFVPEVLKGIHPEWREESFDGIYPEVVRKTGDDEMELIGLCILISDQTFVALHLRLQLERDCDAVSWFECWLGEATADGMRRIPYGPTKNSVGKVGVFARLDSIEWVYHVGYGVRRT
jgi:hypothetical protein